MHLNKLLLCISCFGKFILRDNQLAFCFLRFYELIFGPVQFGSYRIKLFGIRSTSTLKFFFMILKHTFFARGFLQLSIELGHILLCGLQLRLKHSHFLQTGIAVLNCTGLRLNLRLQVFYQSGASLQGFNLLIIRLNLRFQGQNTFIPCL